MSQLPKLRPLTGTYSISQTASSHPYSARNHFLQIKKQQKNSITPDEILTLKTQKAALLEELRRMSAKLARVKTTASSTRQRNTNEHLTESLEKQVQQLKFAISDRRKQIKEIEMSDLAASISELHEESKIIYLEISRLNQIISEKSKHYDNSLEDLEKVTEQYSDEKIQNMDLLIESISKELNKVKHQNMQYEKKLHDIEDHNKSIQQNRGHPELQQRINELEAELKEAQKRVKQQSQMDTN